MRTLLIILFAALCPTEVFADNSLKNCFAHDEESAISSCLTQVYQNLEGTRKIIETDVENMINNDILVPPPKLESNNVIEPSIQKSRVRNKNNIKSEDHLERALKKIREQKAQEIAQRNSHKTSEHLLKKRRVLNSHHASEDLFKEYRQTECEIRKIGAENKNNLFDAIFVYKLCLYEMTDMRIKHLQKIITK